MDENKNAIVTTSTTPVVPFPKIDSDKDYCNGKVHRQERYCHRPAGWGTDHVGEGRCKLHGGCSTGPRAGNLRYSDFVNPAIVQKYEEFAVEEDVDIKKLDHEIAMIRAKVAYIEGLNEKATDVQKAYNDKMVGSFVELIRRLVETKQKVEEGVKSKVTIEIVTKSIEAFIHIIETRVTDPKLKLLLAKDIRTLPLAHLGIDQLN